MNPVDPNDPNLILSPLADPVVSAIFANAEVAGLASESIITATLKAENEPVLVGKIISVTPQRTHSSPKSRGCRVNVDCDRYETVSANPEMRREYAMWFDEALREKGMLDWARQEGRDEVESLLAEAEQKRAEAEQKRADTERKRKADLEEVELKRKADLLSAARIMKNEGISVELITKALSISASEVEKL